MGMMIALKRLMVMLVLGLLSWLGYSTMAKDLPGAGLNLSH